MTTLIAHNGKLHGDRRKVINYHLHGITGVQEGNKIYKLPFCGYGTTGFDLAPTGAIPDYVRRMLCLIFGLKETRCRQEKGSV